MKKTIKSILGLALVANTAFAQSNEMTEEWVAVWDGNGRYEYAQDMEAAQNGDVFVTGYSQKYENGVYENVMSTIKYDTDGTLLWSAQYDGGRYAHASALALGNDGSVVVTGQSQEHNENYYHMTTVKYDGNGNVAWEADLYGTGTYNYAYGIDVKVDGEGNVYAFGNAHQNNVWGVVIAKYDVNGNLLWTAFKAHSNSFYGQRMGIDGAGNAYIIGYKYNQIQYNWNDVMVVKFDSNGTEEWTSVYDSGNNEHPTDAVVTAEGDVYMSVYHYDYNGTYSYDFMTMKMDNAGNVEWTKLHNQSSQYAYPRAIDYNNGHVAVTGYAYNSSNNYDYSTVAYDENGTELWSNSYVGSVHYDYAMDVAVGNNGDVFVTGYSYSYNNNYYGYDGVTVKYEANSGNEEWVAVYSTDDDNYNYEYGYLIDTDAQNNAYVSMYDYNYNNGSNYQDFVTVKYKGSLVEPLVITGTTISDNNGYNVACNGGNSGVVEVAFEGGLEPYVFTVNGTEMENPISGLTAGDYTIVLSDASGQTAEVEVSLTEPTALELVVSNNSTVFFGYDPAACSEVSASVSGGVEAYSLNWSNGSVDAFQTVCPETTTDYFVVATDANGCTVDGTVTVCVVDVRCEKGGKSIVTGQGEKVLVCHRPGGNSNKARTICISADDVADHLAHGCSLGECGTDVSCEGGTAKMASESHVIESHLEDHLVVSLFPNPAINELTIELNSFEEMNGTLTIVNSLGQEVEVLFNGSVSEYDVKSISVDISSLEAGTYFVQFVNSNGERLVKTLVINK